MKKRSVDFFFLFVYIKAVILFADKAIQYFAAMFAPYFVAVIAGLQSGCSLCLV